MSRSAPPLEVSAPRRAVIAQVAADPAVSARDAVHARVLLAAADGVTNVDNARRHGVSVGTVSAWRRAFEVEGLAGFGQVRMGRGRRGTIPGLTLGEVIQAVGRNERSRHPSTARELAVHLGVSEGTLRRVRCDLGLVRGADGRQELPGPH
ncbi:helix-turn-helix domain-containing protein [Actinomyces polynesiensis]|uniref:helix-turn-helix domain-containing protein n=1 Tax=Actinomyces polynesiensis TaxID=1325934 RepID=UPI000ADA8D52|nr:helix-turn-helix domain-containing protein [Actinomyces polynesiensis]